MKDLIAIGSQYGALGLMLIASFWYINKKDNEYQKERKERTKIIEQQYRDALNVTRNNTSAMLKLTAVIKNK